MSQKECAVTGREIINPSQAPRSKVNGTVVTFCNLACKDIFDRYLVKFAEKHFHENGQPTNSTIPNLKYKP